MKDKKIQLAFFKGGTSVISKSIKFITNSKYSHTEIIVGKYWYGANIDLMNKSQITKVERPKVNVEDWDIFDIVVTKKQYDTIIKDLNSYVGSDYNFSGLVKYMIGYNISGNDKFFCSEFATYILIKNKVLKMHKVPISYDPGALYIELNNKFLFTKEKHVKVFKGAISKMSFSNEAIYMEWG